jgi:Zn-dependent membrane protease YugP
VPVVSFSSNILGILYIAMFLIGYMAHMMNELLLLAIILQSAITLFTLITLPVEVDASRRGLAWLNSTRITSGESHEKAVTALRWAGLTYFVAALASIAQLLYLIMAFNNRRN